MLHLVIMVTFILTPDREMVLGASVVPNANIATCQTMEDYADRENASIRVRCLTAEEVTVALETTGCDTPLDAEPGTTNFSCEHDSPMSMAARNWVLESPSSAAGADVRP